MGAPGPRAVARLRAWPFAPHTASTAPRPPRGRTGQDGAVTPAVPARAQQTLVGGQRQDGRGGGDGRGCLCHPARGRGAGSGETPGGWGGGPRLRARPSLRPPSTGSLCSRPPCRPRTDRDPSPARPRRPPRWAPVHCQAPHRASPGGQPAPPPRPAMRKWAPGRGFSWAAASGRGRGRPRVCASAGDPLGASSVPGHAQLSCTFVWGGWGHYSASGRGGRGRQRSDSRLPRSDPRTGPGSGTPPAPGAPSAPPSPSPSLAGPDEAAWLLLGVPTS